MTPPRSGGSVVATDPPASVDWLKSFTLAETHPDRPAWVEFMTQARAFLGVMERTIPEGRNRDEALMRFAKAVMVAHGAYVARAKAGE